MIGLQIGAVILFGLLSLLLWVTIARSRVSVAALVLFLVASGAVVGYLVKGSAARLDALREQYPMISVEERLAYEYRNPNFVSPADIVPLSEEVDKRLETTSFRHPVMESNGGPHNRKWHLRQLHEVTYLDFVGEEGFGIGRMRYYREEALSEPRVESPPPLAIVPTTSEDYDPDNPPLDDHRPELDVEAAELEAQAVGKKLPHDTHEKVYLGGLQSFLNRSDWAYIQDRERVAGFVPHGIYEKVDEFEWLESRSAWRITRLELVSLLKHKTPVAYVSDSLPRMDELGEAETRPLNRFEGESLPRLFAAKDLVTDEGENRIQMLGAIRAGTSCLECHSVRRGELLGAFSYELRRPGRVVERSSSESL